MKLIGSSIIAALANRRSTLTNGLVGASTFALGDAISQAAAKPKLVLSAERGTGRDQQQPSWQQQFMDRTRGVDYSRSAKVGLLGILLNGFALGAWYRVLDRYIGSDRTRIQQVLKKCVIDQMVYAPFSITSFVGYAAVLNGGGPSKVLGDTKRNLEETFWSTWLMDWKVWPAANLVMFRFIPSSYRPSFASVVQVAWQAYMSSVSYDSPNTHHHGDNASVLKTVNSINAGGGVVGSTVGDSDGVILVRGGEGEGGTADGKIAGVMAGAAAAAGGVRGRERREGGVVGHRQSSRGGEVSVVEGHSAIGGRRRHLMVDRRPTGRYAYTPALTSAPVSRTPSSSSSSSSSRNDRTTTVAGDGSAEGNVSATDGGSNTNAHASKRKRGAGGSDGGGSGGAGGRVKVPRSSSSSSPSFRTKAKEL